MCKFSISLTSSLILAQALYADSILIQDNNHTKNLGFEEKIQVERKVTNPSFPNFPEFPSTCESPNCKKYAGTIENVGIGGQSWGINVANSFGFNLDKNKNQTEQNYQVFIDANSNNDLSKIKGVIRGASVTKGIHDVNNGRGGTAINLKNNSVYIKLKSDSVLNLDGQSTDDTDSGGKGTIMGASLGRGVEVSSNQVVIDGGSTKANGVDGGSITSGSIVGGFLTAKKTPTSTVRENMFINDNSVFIKGAKINLQNGGNYFRVIAGGLVRFADAKTQSMAKNNKTFIENSEIKDFYNIAGFFTDTWAPYADFELSNNIVFIKNSILENAEKKSGGGIYGAGVSASTKTSTGNSVFLENSILKLKTSTQSFSIRGNSASYSKVENNVVSIKDSQIQTLDEANENSKSVAIYAAVAQEANANKVYIKNSTLGKKMSYITAAFVHGNDGYNFAGIPPVNESNFHIRKASNNSVIIEDSTLDSGILAGAFVQKNDYTDTSKPKVQRSANSNSLSISNSIFNGTTMVGGLLGSISSNHDRGQEGQAINNKVTIGENVYSGTKDNQSVLNLTNLYGGYAKDMKQAYLGNTLNLHSLVSTQNFGGFQNINFIINEKVLSELNKGKSFLTITGANPTKLHSNINNNNGGLNEHNNNITIYTNLKDGIESIKEDIVLISNNNGITNSNGDRLTKEHLDSMKSKGELINFRSFVTIQRLNSSEFELAMKDKDQDNIDEELIISIPEEPDIPDKPDNPDTLNPQTKALLEANLAYIPTLIQSDDLVNQTMLDSNANIQLDPNNSFYAATKGSFLRYKSGSHIDIDTLSTLIAYGKNINTYNIFNSIFLETGYTKYKTFNDTVLGNTLGDGKHKYLGMGYFIKNKIFLLKDYTLMLM
ncbi:hypothetical protein [Campylobacter armoricus]|uniref:hypothetical protein n=1 Tax=Campylobacter armoricus TaxID=2505970 RepID=UPI001594CBE8|nr:hypothetical protein [Campylobacter armoricus]